MNENELKILSILSRKKQACPSEEAASESGLAHSTIMSLLPGLEQQGFVKVERNETHALELSPEGKLYAEAGTPERRLVNAVADIAKKGGATLEAAFAKAGFSEKEKAIALRWAKTSNWIALSKGSAGTLVELLKAEKSNAEKALEEILKGRAAQVSTETAKLLEQRGLATLKEQKTATVAITKSGQEALKHAAGGGAEKSVSQLTPEMLKSGSWKQHKFRHYEVSTVAAPTSIGLKNYYKEFLERIRTQLIGLGFRETTGPLIETEFWNMDALFMAQDHPARDVHDVFHLKSPSHGTINDKETLKKVRQAHEKGIAGSKGWQYQMSQQTSESLVLRSHDTGISARELAKHLNPPDRVFFFPHVFRPDEIDWKHAIEFTQLGGYVADESMNFRELLGYLKLFAIEVCGAKSTEVKFVPSYYPFTEPSVDLVVNIPGKGWTEMGGAGMFRPEMLEPLGTKVPVLAWGLGVGRLAMLSLGVKDIRNFFSLDEKFLRNAIVAESLQGSK